ncbi:hypothetical protein H0I31_12170 [Tenacibaculum sp. AHE15PA]|uniref:hypothetical protein n=1 Tax=Tenacibaculum TaxID=104267 RepID=UPI001C4E9D4E|nr:MULTISPECIES: hypothetical protein [Tenacibaculum]QXP73713.1 hypothetical protein H0I30_00810 [Tenacibaculum sp. AHE14PA]QXP75920.1 hypothetical protein H0I31_12170 [Tenacibaculum sp. AHE15PA]
MSTQNTSITLKEILLGISESLNEAQHQLRNAAPYDEYGRPNTLYTLPYLDFTLQVETELETSSTTGGTYDQSSGYGKYAMAEMPYSPAPMMTYRPVSKTSSTAETDKITSSISGRFVAVMPNDGLPQLIIEAIPKQTNISNIYDIEVAVFNSAGEKIPGALVEFNYNRDKTILLNTNSVLNHNTNFVKQGEVTTDVNGLAINTIQIDTTDYDAKNTIQIDINIGTVFTKISIQKH